MADPVVHFILRARDEATAKIRAVSGEVGGLSKTITKLSSAFGVAGIVISTLVAAATAAFALARNYATAVEKARSGAGAFGANAEELKKASTQAENFEGQLRLVGAVWQQFVLQLGKMSIGLVTGTLTILTGSLADLVAEIQVTKTWWQDFSDLLKKGVPAPVAAGIANIQQQARGKPAPTSLLGPTGAAGIATVENSPENERRTAQMVAAARERETAIRRLQEALHSTAARAREAQAEIEAFDKAVESKKLAAKVQEIETLAAFNERARQLAAGEIPNVQPRRIPPPTLPISPPVEVDEKARAAALKELEDAFPRVNADLVQLRENWVESSRAMTSAIAVIDNSFQAFAGGLDSGFLQIAQNFTSQTQTIASAARIMRDSVIQEFDAMVAHILATKIIEFIASFAIPGLPSVPGPRGGFGLPTPTLPPVPGALSRAPQQNINIYNKNFSNRDFYASLHSPSGELRRAQQRQRTVRSAGHN